MGSWWQVNSFKLVNVTKSLKFDKCWMDVGYYLLAKKCKSIIRHKLGFQHLVNTMKSYGDLAMFYYHVQCNELTFK
jgi:hypothetical protein